MNSYWPGQSVHIYTESKFRLRGVPTDPGTVTLTVRDPQRTLTTYTYGVDAALMKVDVGDYYLDLEIGTDDDVEGQWVYAWRGTSPCRASDEGEFIVRPSILE